MCRRGLPREVEKIDRQGQVVARYRSMKEAADANFMCQPSVADRCYGRIQKCWDADGCTYRFAESDGRNTPHPLLGRKFKRKKRGGRK